MIRLENVSLAYERKPVLTGLTLHIMPGAHIALMGPSGCGKTTLLQLIGGLLSPDGGTAVVHARRTALVFQEPRLLPTRTALQNVNAVLGDRKATRREAERWLSLVGLSDAADKYPAELSGGMAQRVNIARALAYDADLFLLDEPFKGLDEARRGAIIDLLREHTVGKTLVLATHDRAEAEALCSEILLYKDGTFVPET